MVACTRGARIAAGPICWDEVRDARIFEDRLDGGSSGSFLAAGLGAQPRFGRPQVPRDGACFYRDQNYGGEYFCTDAGRDIPSMPRGLNDEITLIRTFGNVQVTLYRDARFKGRSTSFRGDVRNVGDSWNDPRSRQSASGEAVVAIVTATGTGTATGTATGTGATPIDS